MREPNPWRILPTLKPQLNLLEVRKAEKNIKLHQRRLCVHVLHCEVVICVLLRNLVYLKYFCRNFVK